MAYDVYSYGMVSASTLFVLAGKFPEADLYAEIKDTYKMLGGEAANSSIVLSRLGVKVKLDGNWLGKDEKGQSVLRILKDFQIDHTRLTVKENYKGVEENVFTDGATRTNFGTYVKLFSADRQWNVPLKEDIAGARIVNLDPFFKEESLAGARMCVELGKPYVTVDCKYTDEIAQNAAVVAIAGEFRRNEYKDVEKEALFQKYLEHCNGLVIFTSGSSHVLFGRKGQPVKRCKPYKVEPLDTTGCGDSFRAGIVYGMLQDWPEEKTVDFACAVAACISMSFPGVINAPTLEEVLDRMNQR